MRICLNICGDDILDWKVDCDGYLPDNNGIRNGNPERDEIVADGTQVELSAGSERICVLPKDKYRIYNGVCSCVKSWTDSYAVTR